MQEQEQSPSDLGPSEQHFTILYGDTGHSYESIIALYVKNAQEIVVEDPYIRLTHQIQNFVRFCEAVLKQFCNKDGLSWSQAMTTVQT